MTMHATVSGSFPTQESAEAAVENLRAAGFGEERVALLAGKEPAPFLAMVTANDEYGLAESVLRKSRAPMCAFSSNALAGFNWSRPKQKRAGATCRSQKPLGPPCWPTRTASD